MFGNMYNIIPIGIHEQRKKEKPIFPILLKIDIFNAYFLDRKYTINPKL